MRDGYVNYEHVAEGWTAKVCVGLYSFADLDRLAHIIGRLTVKHVRSMPDMGLGPVLNDYQPWSERQVPSWRDVGDREAIGRFPEVVRG